MRLCAALGRICKYTPCLAEIWFTCPHNSISVNSSQSCCKIVSKLEGRAHSSGEPIRRLGIGISAEASIGTHNTRANLCRTREVAQVSVPVVKGAVQT